MIIQIALGVTLGMVAGSMILRYPKQSLGVGLLLIFVAIVLVVIATLIVLGVWVFNNPEVLVTLFGAFMMLVYAGVILVSALLAVVAAILVSYAVLLGLSLAYEGFKGKRHENELFATFVYFLLGLSVGGGVISFLPISREMKDILAGVYLFVLVTAPWFTAFGWQHSPNFTERFKRVGARQEKTVRKDILVKN